MRGSLGVKDLRVTTGIEEHVLWREVITGKKQNCRRDEGLEISHVL